MGDGHAKPYVKLRQPIQVFSSIRESPVQSQKMTNNLTGGISDSTHLGMKLPKCFLPFSPPLFLPFSPPPFLPFSPPPFLLFSPPPFLPFSPPLFRPFPPPPFLPLPSPVLLPYVTLFPLSRLFPRETAINKLPSVRYGIRDTTMIKTACPPKKTTDSSSPAILFFRFILP
nr:hypothetical protein HmN_000930000 [Hymenolepis microstoma]